MKSSAPEEINDPLKDINVDDEYSYVFVEYDHSEVSFNSIIETIHLIGAHILDSIILREEPRGTKSILFKLDVQDVREVILNLSKHKLLTIKGYNSKTEKIG